MSDLPCENGCKAFEYASDLSRLTGEYTEIKAEYTKMCEQEHLTSQVKWEFYHMVKRAIGYLEAINKNLTSPTEQSIKNAQTIAERGLEILKEQFK